LLPLFSAFAAFARADYARRFRLLPAAMLFRHSYFRQRLYAMLCHFSPLPPRCATRISAVLRHIFRHDAATLLPPLISPLFHAIAFFLSFFMPRRSLAPPATLRYAGAYFRCADACQR